MPNRRARPSCNSHSPVMNGDTERGEEGQCLRTGVKMRRLSYRRGGLFVKNSRVFGFTRYLGRFPLLRLPVLLPYRFQTSAHLARSACDRHILSCILLLLLLLVISYLLHPTQEPSQL